MGCCWPRPRPASPPQPTLAAAPNDDAGEGKGLGAEDSGAAEEASGEAKMPSDASQAAPLRSLTEHQKYVSWLATAARLEREDNGNHAAFQGKPDYLSKEGLDAKNVAQREARRKEGRELEALALDAKPWQGQGSWQGYVRQWQVRRAGQRQRGGEQPKE